MWEGWAESRCRCGRPRVPRQGGDGRKGQRVQVLVHARRRGLALGGVNLQAVDDDAAHSVDLRKKGMHRWGLRSKGMGFKE